MVTVDPDTVTGTSRWGPVPSVGSAWPVPAMLAENRARGGAEFSKSIETIDPFPRPHLKVSAGRFPTLEVSHERDRKRLPKPL